MFDVETSPLAFASCPLRRNTAN